MAQLNMGPNGRGNKCPVSQKRLVIERNSVKFGDLRTPGTDLWGTFALGIAVIWGSFSVLVSVSKWSVS